MLSTPWKPFIHPKGVYRLDYPAHWDQAQQEEGRSCGFGPHDRDNVGLWISILPMSVDTDRLAEDLPDVLGKAFPPAQAGELRPDPTLRHYGLKAEVHKEGEAGHYWIVAGGDVVLFASSQVPSGERDTWNPAFERLMASLQITRDDELFVRQLTNEVLELLRRKYPDQDFQLDEKGIRGGHRVVFLSNLAREIREAPRRRADIIRHFVDSLGQSEAADIGRETWDEARSHILPVLKPRNYVAPGGPTENLLTSEWLVDVIVCYAIHSKNLFRFVTPWDVDRWGTEAQTLHQLALDNLSRLPWPSRLEGARQNDGGRVIVVETNDSMAASRLLHPDLHRLFSGPLGSPFWAGIPDRGTLVVYSDRRRLKQRIARRLRVDYRKSAYPITPRPFMVTADGIAPGPE
jgi:uncharacterized protein YtpQ (UPF0354 family)